jgi:hypothetical protein
MEFADRERIEPFGLERRRALLERRLELEDARALRVGARFAGLRPRDGELALRLLVPEERPPARVFVGAMLTRLPHLPHFPVRR